MTNSFKGTVCGIAGAMAYGTNPLFSLPLFKMGVDLESVLFFRYVGATLVFGILLKLMGIKLGLKRHEILPLFMMGLLFALSSQTLYQSFFYIDAGIACSILFTYPILVAVFQTVFFHQRTSLLTTLCILTAVMGVCMLYRGDGKTTLNTAGLLLVVLSSICYSIYIIGVDHSVLKNIPSGKMTFWVLVTGTLLFFLLTGCLTRLKFFPMNTVGWINVFGVALLPTVIPIFFINVAIKNIGPTLSAIIGALEPVTALIIGVLVFNEHMTLPIAVGVFLILMSVATVVGGKYVNKIIRNFYKEDIKHLCG